MSKASTVTIRGFSVFTLLFGVLLVLKIAGQAGASWGLPNLSWFWVLAPLLTGWAISLTLIVVFIMAASLAGK